MRTITFTKKYENDPEKFRIHFSEWIEEMNLELNPRGVYLHKADFEEDISWDGFYNMWRGWFNVTGTSRQLNINNFLTNYIDFFDSVYCEDSKE